MSSKSFFLAVLTHAIVFVAGWFANDYLKSDNEFIEGQISIIERERDSLKTEIKIGDEKIFLLKDLATAQRVKIDSLEIEIRKIKLGSRTKEKTIDSLIATDSLRAIEQYRLALENLGVIPDMSERLTLREIGHGAKFINRIPMLELERWLLNSTIDSYQVMDSIKTDTIDELERQNDKYSELVEQTEIETDLYKQAYEHATRFWANRIIVYLGVGGNYNANQKLDAGLQLGIGFKIWGNK